MTTLLILSVPITVSGNFLILANIFDYSTYIYYSKYLKIRFPQNL